MRTTGLLLLSLAAALASGCKAVEETEWLELEDIRLAFAAEEVTGVVVVYDPQEEVYLTNDRKRANVGYLPASTYKVFNSLVALETGVIEDEEESLKWDGIVRSIENWNRDNTMRSAIRYSTVWFYQELARRIGQERMQSYVDQAGYGNRDISGGIDRFWLDGGLRITPAQQVDLLVRLRNSDLPFSERSMSIVRDIMVLERTDSFVLRGKTGWADSPTPGVGWFIGYVEQGDRVYFFATEIDMDGIEDAPKRRAITERVLRELGVSLNE